MGFLHDAEIEVMKISSKNEDLISMEIPLLAAQQVVILISHRNLFYKSMG